MPVGRACAKLVDTCAGASQKHPIAKIKVDAALLFMCAALVQRTICVCLVLVPIAMSMCTQAGDLMLRRTRIELTIELYNS